MLADQTQLDGLPLSWTYVTQESFNEMRKSWVEAWTRKCRLTRAEYLVLRELAFKVDVELGVAYPRQDRLAEHLGVVRKTVNRAIQRLARLGAIEVLSEGGRLQTRGRMNNYLIRFDRVPTDDGYVSGPFFLALLEPLEIATREAPCPTNVPPMSHACPTDTSYTSDTGDTDMEVLRTSARTASGTRERKPTRRQAEEKRQAEEDALDPAKSPEILALFDLPETAEVRTPEKAPARPGERRSRTISPDSSMGLALAFRDALTDYDWRAIDLKGMAPLARHIAGWKRDGISPDTIRQMIKIYAGNERLRSADKRKAPWLDFVGKLHLLLSEAQRPVAAAQSDDYWNQLAGDQGQSPDESDMW